MILQTERLLLRPWEENDAPALYEYARDPLVGPAAGWSVHTRVEDSLDVIRNVLSAAETYAVLLRNGAQTQPIGSIGLMTDRTRNPAMGKNDGEIGYWIGVPFWGKGYIPEAVNELLRHAFEDLNMETIWCGYYDGNEKSLRVQEKCGFLYRHTEQESVCPFLGEVRAEHFTAITKAEWVQCKQAEMR